MPLSIALRMMLMLSCSVKPSVPMCQPPRPRAETFSPVLPSARVGIVPVAPRPHAVEPTPAATPPATASLTNSRRVTPGFFLAMASSGELFCMDSRHFISLLIKLLSKNNPPSRPPQIKTGWISTGARGKRLPRFF